MQASHVAAAAAGAGAVAAVLAALATIWRLGILPTYRLGRRVDIFLDDWFGEPARPGRPGVPSMPARIATVEEDLARLREDLADHLEESTADRADLRARIVAEADDHDRLAGG